MISRREESAGRCRTSSRRGRQMSRPLQRVVQLFSVLWLSIGSFTLADPCGMVPPIYIDGDAAIARIGL